MVPGIVLYSLAFAARSFFFFLSSLEGILFKKGGGGGKKPEMVYSVLIGGPEGSVVAPVLLVPYCYNVPLFIYQVFICCHY